MKIVKLIPLSFLALSLSSCGLRSKHAFLIKEGYQACKEKIYDIYNIDENSYKDKSVDYVYFVETTGFDTSEEVVAYSISFTIDSTSNQDYYYYHSSSKNVMSISVSRFTKVYNEVNNDKTKGEVGSIK